MTLDVQTAPVAPPETTPAYETLLDLVKYRMSVRNLRPDLIPDEYVTKVLEVARWAMSGANSQPWEFVVVKDAAMRRKLYDTYMGQNMEFLYWMEKQRHLELRHPSFQVPGVENPREELEIIKTKQNWWQAPVHIVVLGDGRRQWGTVQGAHTFGRGQTHLWDSLANCSQLIHLAAASLGLGAQWVTIHIPEAFAKVMDTPDLLTYYLIIPLGWPAVERRPGWRRELSEIVHHDNYDRALYMSDEDAYNYLRRLRGATIPKYQSSEVDVSEQERAARDKA
ncbi:MAG TPA: nitroreductase family protein [Chloroflexota bacterium]|jgi:nitroreductase